MKETRQLFYVSAAAPGLGEFDLRSILSVSRANNFRSAITGCLMYSGRHFAQVIEGYDADVSRLFARIQTDERHHNVKVLLDRVHPRMYGEWTMGSVYKLDLDDQLERVLSTPEAGASDAFALMAEVHIDTVLGSL